MDALVDFSEEREEGWEAGAYDADFGFDSYPEGCGNDGPWKCGGRLEIRMVVVRENAMLTG